jgi:hypothetical protein
MAIEVYRRRAPESTLIYQVVQENLPAFLELTDRRGRGLPKYVKSGFRKFLECGILRNGFARVRCPGCGYDAVVAFS